MKKILCVLLIFVLSLTSVFATATDEQLKDLKNLKIMVGDEDGNMRLDDSSTRAEAAKMICVIQGIGTDSFADTVEPSAFPDVADSHWAKNYINAVKDLQIMIGDEKGNFNPEAEITNEEIIKTLIVALGYKEMAETTGGYPMGYTRTAQKIGLTEELKLDVDVPAKRGDVAYMFATALDIPLMVQTSWSPSGGGEYRICDGSDGLPIETIRTMFFGKNENTPLKVVK